MALRFIDSGGQHYVNATNNATQYLVLRKWTQSGSFINGTGGRRNAPYIGNLGAVKTLTFTQTWILGAAYKVDGGTSGNLHLIQNNGAQIAVLFVNADATISVYAGQALIYTSTLALSDKSTWHHYGVEWTCTGSGTATGTLTGSVWVDSLLWGTFSGQSNSIGNNYLNGSYCANQVGFGGGVDCMDYYAFDTNGIDLNGHTTTNTFFIGDVQVDALFPVTDVTTNWSVGSGGDGTHAWSVVNDPIVVAGSTYSSPDDDSSYLLSTSTGSAEAFNYQSISTFTGTIYGVQYLVCAKKDAEGSRDVAMTVGTATVTSANFLGTANFLSDYYVYYICPLDSNNGTAWTVANYDSQQFGLTLIG